MAIRHRQGGCLVDRKIFSLTKPILEQVFMWCFLCVLIKNDMTGDVDF